MFPFHAVPRDPPTNLQLVATSEMELALSWTTPTSCLYYGGAIQSYTIRYRYRLQGTAFVSNEVDTPDVSTVYALPDLLPGTLYEVMVATRNAIGLGTFSTVAMETTLLPIGKEL